MSGEVQITLTKTGNVYNFAPHFETQAQGDVIAFPKIEKLTLEQLKTGTPEQVQKLLSTLANI